MCNLKVAMMGMGMFRRVRVQIANIFRISFFSRGNPNSFFLMSDYPIAVLVILIFWPLGHLFSWPSPFQAMSVTNLFLI